MLVQEKPPIRNLLIVYREVLKYPVAFKKDLYTLEKEIYKISKKLNKKDKEVLKNYAEDLDYSTYTSVEWFLLGDYFANKLNFPEQALLFFHNAKVKNPENNDIFRIMGDVCAFKKKNPQQAINYYEKFIEKDQSNYMVYNTLGHLYEKVDKYNNIEKYLGYFEKAHELTPTAPEPLRNIGIVAPRINREEEAFRAYTTLFKLKQAKPDDYFDYACLKIKMKNFQEGWKYYEERFNKTYGATPYPKITKPKWTGKKILNKNLLINWEQGFGDSIQFSRYIKQVEPLVGHIIFRVQNSLVSLFKQQEFFKNIEIIGEEPIEEINFDYHIALMSLPYILYATVKDIPYPEGHLKATEDQRKLYKRYINNPKEFKVGISYSGMATGNSRRNVPLEAFYPLARLKGVQVYSFQKDAGSEQLKGIPEDVNIIDLGTTFSSWEDTAGAMANMDLFITSDNAVFNLSATLGIDTCLLLSQDAEWRWFNSDKKVPWYNSVEIFKKKHEDDDWSMLIEELIKVRLASYI